jgi:hypothetical protein
MFHRRPVQPVAVRTAARAEPAATRGRPSTRHRSPDRPLITRVRQRLRVRFHQRYELSRNRVMAAGGSAARRLEPFHAHWNECRLVIARSSSGAAISDKQAQSRGLPRRYAARNDNERARDPQRRWFPIGPKRSSLFASEMQSSGPWFHPNHVPRQPRGRLAERRRRSPSVPSRG